MERQTPNNQPISSYTRSLHALQSLKNHLNYVKAEFEAEGTRSEELSFLKSIVASANSSLVIKIGGSQAFRDLVECTSLETKNVLVPMIESAEALSLFLEGRHSLLSMLGLPLSYSRVLINIETATAVDNLDSILQVAGGHQDFCGVVIGRSDLTASLGIPRSSIESEEVLSLCKTILLACKEYGCFVTLGGNITPASFKTVRFLADHGLDAFETRKCCIVTGNYGRDSFAEMINSALLFEQELLALYDSLAKVNYQQTSSRIAALESRKI